MRQALKDTYADDGIYTVTVSVTDDDEGSDSQAFRVTVSNVQPSLAGLEDLASVDEGTAFTLVASKRTKLLPPEAVLSMPRYR